MSKSSRFVLLIAILCVAISGSASHGRAPSLAVPDSVPAPKQTSCTLVPTDVEIDYYTDATWTTWVGEAYTDCCNQGTLTGTTSDFRIICRESCNNPGQGRCVCQELINGTWTNIGC